VTQQSNVTAPAAAPIAAVQQAEPAPTLEARAAEILKAPTEEQTTEAKTETAEVSKEGKEAKPPSQVEADPAKRKAERDARLAAAAAEGRRRVDAKARLAEQDAARREAEAAKARAAELEAQLAKRIDPSKLDEAAFFALAAEAKIEPAKLAEFLKTSISDPSRVAASAAAKQLDPRLAEMQAKLDAAQARLDAIENEKKHAAQAAQERAHETEFVSFVKSAADSSPRAAAFAEKFGDEEFLKVARSVALTVPEGAGAQALLDSIEDRFEQLSAMYAPAAPAAAQTSKSQTTKAPAKPTTVSNTNAQERASVVEDDEWSSLSIEERAARIKRG